MSGCFWRDTASDATLEAQEDDDILDISSDLWGDIGVGTLRLEGFNGLVRR